MQRAQVVYFAILGTVLGGGAACSDGGEGAAASRSTMRREISVAAAANLQPVWPALVEAFRRERPDCTPIPVFGSTGALVAQALNGAPYDVFLAADVEAPRKLVAAGAAEADAVVPYAVGRLALWTRFDSGLSFEDRGIEAVRDARVTRIALAKPATAPFGAAAERALRGAGLLDVVKDRLVYGESVAEAAQFAETGAATVAFVALSQAAASPLKDRGRWTEISLAPGDAPVQAGVVLRRARDPAAAAAFFAFVRGPAGRAVLLQAGYAAPPGD